MEVLAEGGIGGAVMPRGGASAESGLAASLLDEMSQGALVTTLDGRLLHANRSALLELARGRALQLCGGLLSLCAGRPGALDEALVRAAHGERSLIEFPCLLTLAVAPCGPDRLSARHAALLFGRTTLCDPQLLGMFARMHGLTPMEEQVLGILCLGLSAPEAATRLDVAVSTVRSHVRNLCAKTRSSSVRALVSRLAMLPALAPPNLQWAVH